MQTSSSVVVETTPWPSIMIVATMNGISAPNFTMNATKFHITMPRKLATCSAKLPHSVALCAMQYFSCASLLAIQKHCSRHRRKVCNFRVIELRSSAEVNSIRARSQSWGKKIAEILYYALKCPQSWNFCYIDGCF